MVLLAPPLLGQQPKKNKEPDPLAVLPVTQAWELLLEHAPSAGGALDAARIYIPLESNQIIALDRRTGLKIWTAELASTLPPVVSGNSVYIAVGDTVHALDTATGVRRWQLRMDSRIGGSMTDAGGRLIAPLVSGQVAAIDLVQARAAWTSQVDIADSRLALGNDAARLYVASSSGRLTALSIVDGRQIWQRTLDGALTAPLVTRDRLIVGSTANRFDALNPLTGKERWHWPVGADAVGAGTDPLATGKDKDLVVLATLDNSLKAVKGGNGQQQWRAVVTTRPSAPPLVFGGTVVVIGNSPVLSAYSAKKGDVMGTYVAPAQLKGPPLIDLAPKPFAVSIVVIMADGNVVALTSEAMQFKEPSAQPITVLPGRQLPREALPGPALTRPALGGPAPAVQPPR
jgi:outer membrane protein assembly factor BamB